MTEVHHRMLQRVTAFIHREACLADESRYAEWESLVTDDMHYWVPAGTATGDPAEQARLYAEAQAIVRDEAPVIPLDYGATWWVSREDLRGGRVSGVGLMRYADLAWAD